MSCIAQWFNEDSWLGKARLLWRGHRYSPPTLRPTLVLVYERTDDDKECLVAGQKMWAYVDRRRWQSPDDSLKGGHWSFKFDGKSTIISMD
jgi:hypothetical protein